MPTFFVESPFDLGDRVRDDGVEVNGQEAVR